MAISDDAAAIAASNLVVAYATTRHPGAATNATWQKTRAEQIPVLFKQFMEVVQQGLLTLPPVALEHDESDD